MVADLQSAAKQNSPVLDGPDFDGHKVDFDEAIKRGQMYKDFEKHAYEESCNLLNKEVK